ncbi:hypothetical protein [Limnobacter sp.]|uniref:hypothetical protein n=1 Tax=Limnobacter sp. TaxID=2003368 RepID=UPI002587F4AD|nr:hypothetical protein [Limnobacter sp.]
MKKLKLLMVVGATGLLSSCNLSEIPGLDNHLSLEDSKAIGAACRHSGRALEDCFKMNPMAHQAGIFDGWRDMNDYMMSNNLAIVKPQIQNSAYEPGKAAGGATAEGQPHSDVTDTAPDRERWTPPGVDKDSKADGEDAKVAESKPDNAKADDKAGGAQKVPEAAVDKPLRPWERKKDPKNHT